MRTPLRRIVRDQDRAEIDVAIQEALRKVRLAMSEVKVVERKKDGKVTHRAVVNKDALDRVRRAYTNASMIVGKARQADGTTEGPQRPDRQSVRLACDQLNQYQRELATLEGL